jgi:hypothetical protein
MGPVFDSEFGMLYIMLLLLLLVGYSCILLLELTFHHGINGSIQDLDHPFLAQAIQGRPLELHPAVAGSTFFAPCNFNKDLVGR